jgi:hypothetical protein
MKKAQIQMSENVIILFLFFILLAFGVVFFTKVQGAKTEMQVQEDIQGRALQTAQKVTFLPEIQCSKDNVVTSDCYDLFNLLAMSRLAERGESHTYYASLLGNAIMTVYAVFPINATEPFVIYNNSKENYTSINTAYIPIRVCNFASNTAEDDCTFSVLKSEVYN